MSADVYSLPPNLPVPEDDGAADHLLGLELPDLELESSQGTVNVRDFDVIYVYPRSGRPGVPMLPGWDETPGARGCTPESCAFRDLYPELGVPVAGLSAQSLDDQLEFAERNRMPFPVIADPELRLGAALRLPTFEIQGRGHGEEQLSMSPPPVVSDLGASPPGLTLYKRLTLVAQDARIVKVFYPVFPPDANAGDVLSWLRNR
jgi:peroxiredoxin